MTTTIVLCFAAGIYCGYLVVRSIGWLPVILLLATASTGFSGAFWKNSGATGGNLIVGYMPAGGGMYIYSGYYYFAPGQTIESSDGDGNLGGWVWAVNYGVSTGVPKINGSTIYFSLDGGFTSYGTNEPSTTTYTTNNYWAVSVTNSSYLPKKWRVEIEGKSTNEFSTDFLSWTKVDVGFTNEAPNVKVWEQYFVDDNPDHWRLYTNATYTTTVTTNGPMPAGLIQFAKANTTGSVPTRTQIVNTASWGIATNNATSGDIATSTAIGAQATYAGTEIISRALTAGVDRVVAALGGSNDWEFASGDLGNAIAAAKNTTNTFYGIFGSGLPIPTQIEATNHPELWLVPFATNMAQGRTFIDLDPRKTRIWSLAPYVKLVLTVLIAAYVILSIYDTLTEGFRTLLIANTGGLWGMVKTTVAKGLFLNYIISGGLLSGGIVSGMVMAAGIAASYIRDFIPTAELFTATAYGAAGMWAVNIVEAVALVNDWIPLALCLVAPAIVFGFRLAVDGALLLCLIVSKMV